MGLNISKQIKPIQDNNYSDISYENNTEIKYMHIICFSCDKTFKIKLEDNTTKCKYNNKCQWCNKIFSELILQDLE